MKIDLIKYAVNNLFQRKTRSILTTISILIGIMAIFTLMSFGQGLQEYIDDIAAEMGTDKIIIQPRGFGAPGTSSVVIPEEDLNLVNKFKGIERTIGITFDSGQVYFKDDGDFEFVYVIGHEVKEEKDIILFEEFMTVEVEKGRQLKDGDLFKAVLGYNYQFPDKVFKRPIAVGDKININGFSVDVIGFYESIGNPSDDENIYLTLEGAERIFESADEYDMLFARASIGENTADLAEKVSDKLRRSKDQKEGEEDLTIETFEQAIEAFTNIVSGLRGVLVAIATISLFVAGVNIMNTMYTSVLERTKEIGVMKAIGARNSEIINIFLIEAGLVGLIGGSLGVLAGYLVSSAGAAIAANAGFSFLKPVFPFWLIAGCLLFAFLVGMLSGLPPSIQASKQNPVDALRYE